MKLVGERSKNSKTIIFKRFDLRCWPSSELKRKRYTKYIGCSVGVKKQQPNNK